MYVFAQCMCHLSQGIKSEHFADGVVNLYYTGREYDDIFPVWDWQRLPGITCEQHIPLLPCNYDFKVKSSNFVGGVSNSEHGAAAMHLMSHNLSSLNSWFFFGDFYVAMGTNISCTSGNPVYTSLANRLLDGNVTVRVAGVAAPITLKEGNYKYSLGDSIAKDRLLWVHHGNTGYFPLRSDGHGLGGNVEFLLSTMYVNNMPRTGDWSSIGGYSLFVCLSALFCFFLFVCLFVCLSVRLSVRLSVCMSVCLSVCLFVCLFVCLSV